MKTLLVIDDDTRLRELVGEYLSGRGYHVRFASDGEQGLQQLRQGGIDLVILDLMLPGIDGLEVCRRLRAFSQVPVLMLTARGDDTDRIVGLELGADDYLPKPFNPRELAARIHAILRRVEPAAPASSDRIVVGDIVIDPGRRTVTVKDQPIVLTTTEFDILRALAANAERVLPRERVMELARGEDFAAFERAVDVHISHLRKKIGDDPKNPRLLKTIRGVGYTLVRG